MMTLPAVALIASGELPEAVEEPRRPRDGQRSLTARATSFQPGVVRHVARQTRGRHRGGGRGRATVVV